jgi:DGQHR domain-containing protein
MLATKIRQKEASFYFISFPAEDLLRKVRFTQRYYDEDAPREMLEAEAGSGDDVSSFIGRVERADKAFQRKMAQHKIKAIRNFYETATSQPPIPGTVLLFTPEDLAFEPMTGFEQVGDLAQPLDKFLIIDGQHRLAALHFYLQNKPEEARSIHVPCVVFDGKADDFAAEMFVIINSTPTRINKSHLIDLYERVTWAEPDRKLAAKVTEWLYSEADSPLRYRINRLGGRSKQEKWILQAELFNEIHRWVKKAYPEVPATSAQASVLYEILRDFFRAAAPAWGEAWGNPNYMVTRPVTLKALVRVCADLAAVDAAPTEGRVARWSERLEVWGQSAHDFRAEGFYERFAAKGQVERVARLHRELARRIGLDSLKS